MRKLLQIAFLFIGFTSEYFSFLKAQDESPKASSPDLGSANRTRSTAATETKATNVTQEKKNWIDRAKRILEIGIAGLTKSEQKKELVKLKPNADDDPRYLFAFVLVAMNEKQWSRKASKHSLNLDGAWSTMLTSKTES